MMNYNAMEIEYDVRLPSTLEEIKEKPQHK